MVIKDMVKRERRKSKNKISFVIHKNKYEC